MNILNLPEFEVLDTIQDDHDMTVIVKPVKEPVACPECGGETYTFTTAFSWNDFVGSTKLTEGFGVDIPQLLEVLESDKF